MFNGIDLDVENIREQLVLMERRMATIDVDKVRRNGAKATAEDMTQMVRDAVSAHPDISSPANLQSRYYVGSPDSSKGHPLTVQKAWEVDQVGDNSYRVRPRANVRRKAMLMEFGRSSITTAPDNPMRFWVDGVPVFTHEVDAVKPKYYWRTAVRKIRADGVLSDNLKEELRKEFREAGYR